MRLLPFLAVTALVFVAPPVVRADTPLRPPEKHVAHSRNRAIEAESDPQTGLTTVYRVDPAGARTRLWAMAGWYRALYPADDGEHLVLGFDGLNLLPTNAADDLVVLRFVRRGEVVAALTLRDVVPDRSILRRTASHLAWREGEGFDADGHFLVITMDGMRHPYDATTGRAIDRRPPTEAPTDLEPLTTWMTGTFSSAAQAKADPDYVDAVLHLARIWSERTDAVWFYVEQAHAKSPQIPYRQRVHRLRALVGGTVESQVYDVPEPGSVVGAWKEANPLAAVTPERLVERVGCAVLLRAVGDTTFAGSTAGRQCADTVEGATYATSELTVTPKGLLSWDRGYDAAGKQVWGPTKGPYRFERVNPK